MMNRLCWRRAVAALTAPLLISLAPLQPAADRTALLAHLAQAQQAFEKEPAGFPLVPGAAELIDRSVRRGSARRAGQPHILRFDPKRRTGVAFLSGTIETGNSGDETSMSLLYSGLYRVSAAGGAWRIGERIPLAANSIRSQKLDVDLKPEFGLSMRAELGIAVGSAAGFAAGLNRKAILKHVGIGGRPARHVFQDGLLWVDAPKGPHRLSLAYDLEVERPEEGGNSGAFRERFGHVRNQYYWHPLLGFGINSGLADFEITVRAPRAVRVALDIPQSESLAGGIRTVRGKSPVPIIASTLAYDADWKVRRYKAGAVTLHLFATQDHEPKPEDLVEQLNQTWNILSARFGTSALDRISIVQGRARQGNGWHFMSNQAIVTGPKGGQPVNPARFPPRAFFPHEVAHLWTNPTGDARNFLGEGWATYAESLILRSQYGEEMERWFWRDQQRAFLNDETQRTTPLLKDVSNSGVSYSKGAWVFAMIERLVGRPSFDRAIRAYSGAPLSRTDLDGFIAAFGPDAAKVGRFIRPWLEEAGGLRLTPRRDGDRVMLVQQPAYWLPDYEVGVEDAAGNVRVVTLAIEGDETVLPVSGREVARLHLDPRERYLMQSPRILDLRPTDQAMPAQGELAPLPSLPQRRKPLESTWKRRPA